jgi:hypothetical protein
MFNIVKKAIDEFNPYGLFPDAPGNEFDSESRKIAAQLNVNNTPEEIADIISGVLSRSFDRKFEAKECMMTAEKIHKSMKNR